MALYRIALLSLSRFIGTLLLFARHTTLWSKSLQASRSTKIMNRRVWWVYFPKLLINNRTLLILVNIFFSIAEAADHKWKVVVTYSLTLLFKLFAMSLYIQLKWNCNSLLTASNSMWLHFSSNCTLHLTCSPFVFIYRCTATNNNEGFDC